MFETWVWGEGRLGLAQFISFMGVLFINGERSRESFPLQKDYKKERVFSDSPPVSIIYQSRGFSHWK